MESTSNTSATQQMNNSFLRPSSPPSHQRQVPHNQSNSDGHQDPDNENRYCPSNHLLVRDFPPAFSCDCCGRSFPAGTESYACRAGSCFYDCCSRCYCAPTCRARNILE